jgi:long-chain acyl-CoA synthetase
VAERSQILEHVERAARTIPGHTALSDDARFVTYYQLWEEAEASAAALAAIGVEPGQAVGLLFPNSAEFVAALLGTAKAGSTAILFPPALPIDELRQHRRAAGARVILAAPALGGRVEAAGGMTVKGDGPCWTAFAFDGAADRWTREGDFIGQLTSGVDKASKLAIRTHAAVWAEIEDTAAAIEMTSHDATLVLSSASHSYGLIGGTLAPLCHGGRAMLRPGSAPGEVPRFVAEHHATILFGLPIMYRAMTAGHAGGPRAPVSRMENASPPREDAASIREAMSPLRLCFSAGARLSPDVEDAFADRFGIPISQDYGTTEAGVISMRLRPEPGGRGSVGHPLRHHIVRVVDPDGRTVGPGRLGEVTVRSPALARAYLEGPDRTPTPIGDTFGTGDLGWISEDGNLFLAGRVSSMIHVAGLAINPVEVEEIIGTLPGVREVAVFARPGEGRLRAVLVAGGITASEIQQHCRRHLADAKVPAVIEFRDALPRTPAGKIIRRALE